MWGMKRGRRPCQTCRTALRCPSCKGREPELKDVITRFAPSPTGFLHLGHAYAALFAFEQARRAGGRFLIRIEDIDATRCRPEFEQAIFEDLAWLGEGLPGWGWEEPVRRQSENMDSYAKAAAALQATGLAYPCFCTRAQILAEVQKAAAAPHESNTPVYPGTCRTLSASAQRTRMEEGARYALRLNMTRALKKAGELFFREEGRGELRARPETFGDFVIARKEMPASYHLACTLDDDLQGVTLVTRGVDLAEATHVQRLLQALLGLKTPDYLHHKLVRDESGRRLAKRDKDATIRALRESGMSPADVRALAYARAEEAPRPARRA